ASGGALIAMLRVERSGFYKVELQGPDGHMVTGSLDYTIDALPDRPPTVKFVKPGRDLKVLSVDEVYSEARAEDDYGVAKLELGYDAGAARDFGRPHVCPRRVPLAGGRRGVLLCAGGGQQRRGQAPAGDHRHLLPPGPPVRAGLPAATAAGRRGGWWRRRTGG